MRIALVACLTCLALMLAPDVSFAAAKKKIIAGAKCETGKSCSTDCGEGWCSRYVCVGGTWEKRLPACSKPFCGPPC